jgi:hypothetical protein
MLKKLLVIAIFTVGLNFSAVAQRTVVNDA